MEGEPGRADAKRLCEQFHHIHTRLPAVLDLGDCPRAEPRAAAKFRSGERQRCTHALQSFAHSGRRGDQSGGIGLAEPVDQPCSTNPEGGGQMRGSRDRRKPSALFNIQNRSICPPCHLFKRSTTQASGFACLAQTARHSVMPRIGGTTSHRQGVVRSASEKKLSNFDTIVALIVLALLCLPM